MSTNFVRVSVAFLLIACFSFTALADTIRLKDGSKIKGKIVGFSGGRFVVAMGEGSRRRELTVAAAEVDSIDFDTPAQPHVALNTIPASATRNAPVARPQDNRVNTQPTSKVSPPPTPTIEEEKEEVPEKVATSAPAPVTPTRKTSLGKPVELSVRVLADNTANGWTNSGWIVKKGQRIRISGSGQVSIGRGKSTGPSGLYDLEDDQKLLKSVPTGALIAVIGDDNNDFIYIGAEREFTATRDGALFLGLNEGNLNDNTGSFDVKVEISPDGGE